MTPVHISALYALLYISDGKKKKKNEPHPQLTVFYYSCVQGSYWAIDTNPKEDALPTRPKKRPRSGERVSIGPFTLLYLPHAQECTSRLYVTLSMQAVMKWAPY